jgi:hypothetical protein
MQREIGSKRTKMHGKSDNPEHDSIRIVARDRARAI